MTIVIERLWTRLLLYAAKIQLFLRSWCSAIAVVFINAVQLRVVTATHTYIHIITQLRVYVTSSSLRWELEIKVPKGLS